MTPARAQQILIRSGPPLDMTELRYLASMGGENNGHIVLEPERELIRRIARAMTEARREGESCGGRSARVGVLTAEIGTLKARIRELEADAPKPG